MGSTIRGSRASASKSQDSVASQPDVTPGRGHADHSFTLQAVMELQKTTGQLASCIDALQKTIDKADVKHESSHSKIDAKLEKFNDTLSSITHKIYAAGAVLAVLVALGGFIVNKAWDMMASKISVTVNQQTDQKQQHK